jgi:NADPH-dependent ferric siderophore reductase
MTSTARVMLGALAGRFLLRRSRVTSRETWGRFVRLDLEGDSLRDAGFRAGDKVQAFLPGGGMRTYTPLHWSGGSTSLLVFRHGEGPGAAWAGGLGEGDEVGFFGPRRSVDVSAVEGPLVVFGDETSLAVAVALSRARPQRTVTAVLEVGEVSEARAALDGVGALLDVHLVRRREAAAHLPEVVEHLRASLSAGDGFGIFSGRAASVQAVKRGLAGLEFSSKTKAYWAEGKRGLD